ncbi:MAG: hypothetical protein EPN84_12340, partial [Legionella sp.]
AQWAVLNRNTEVYQFALTQALTNLNRSFNLHNQNTKTVLQQIETLQKINLTQEKPPASDALQQLNQLINSKESK